MIWWDQWELTCWNPCLKNLFGTLLMITNCTSTDFVITLIILYIIPDQIGLSPVTTHMVYMQGVH